MLAITALTASLAAERALAQAAAPAAPAASAAAAAQKAAGSVSQGAASTASSDNAAELGNTVVIVGSANPAGQRKLAAGYAVTTISEDALKAAAPTSAADAMKLVPGLFAETTGGVSGPNIEVRGFPTGADAKFVTMQIDSLPIFPVSSLSYLDNSTQIRLDDTIARVEATIGGQAVLFGSGQPGATVNFVQKNGRDYAGGLAGVTYGSGNLMRFDGYYGTELAKGWYGSVGGFYRTDNGIRDTQFPADQGHQFVANLTHDLEDGGTLTLYTRQTKDKNAFFTSMPLIQSGSGNDITLHSFPGFNPSTGSLLGNATRVVTYDIASNGTNTPVSQTVDLGNGRGLSLSLFGVDLDKKFGGVSFSNKLAYSSGTTPTLAEFTGPTPVTLGAFIASEVAIANANTAAVGAAGRLATTGSATSISTGKALTDMNQYVIGVGINNVFKKISSFQDEARLSFDLSANNTLTGGVYYADYDSDDTWYTGHNQLMTVQNHAQPINLVLDNGVKITNGSGVYAPTATARHNLYNGTNEALFLSDQWKITPKLKADIGVRHEWERVDETLQNTAKQNISTDPLALYDLNAMVLLPSTTPVSYRGSNTAFNTDANYELAHNVNAFIGYNKGYSLPTFDDLRSNVRTTTRVNQVQGGIKTAGHWFSADLTTFYNSFRGQPSSQTLTDGTVINYLTSSNTYGLEFDGVVRPTDAFSVTVAGDYQHGKYVAGGPGITGNQVQRNPQFQARMTPSYKFITTEGVLTLYATGTYVSKRFADIQNQQPLPRYATLDIGARWVMPDGIEILLTGTNVTNTLGITEGNTRQLGSGVASGGVFLGRPLFGPDYQLSVKMQF